MPFGRTSRELSYADYLADSRRAAFDGMRALGFLLTFPLAIHLRYTRLESPERRQAHPVRGHQRVMCEHHVPREGAVGVDPLELSKFPKAS